VKEKAMNHTTRERVHGALAVARALLASNRPLGRLCLAALAHSAREDWRRERVSLDTYRKEERIAAAEEVALAFEAAQLAKGFAVSAQELENAEAVVVPAAVERFPNAGHASPLAALDGEEPRRSSGAAVSGAAFEIRAEHRDDSRGRGAFVACDLRIGDHPLRVTRYPRGKGNTGVHVAHDSAFLFVGRYAALGRAMLAVVQDACGWCGSMQSRTAHPRGTCWARPA
jgi:hypothetical protein